MSNVLEFRPTDPVVTEARARTDRITSSAISAMKASSPVEWKQAIDRAVVLQAMYTGDLWHGSIFGPRQDELSPFVVLAALIFMGKSPERIADYFAEASITPEAVIGRLVSEGMPIAEKLAGGVA